MKAEAQRRAIAISRGWTPRETQFPDNIHKWHRPDGTMAREDDIPDYLKDLNACAEFEAALSPVLRSIYCDLFLYGRVQTVNDDPKFRGAVWRAITATAPERCEAYLRVIGKWEDAK